MSTITVTERATTYGSSLDYVWVRTFGPGNVEVILDLSYLSGPCSHAYNFDAWRSRGMLGRNAWAPGPEYPFDERADFGPAALIQGF